MIDQVLPELHNRRTSVFSPKLNIESQFLPIVLRNNSSPKRNFTSHRSSNMTSKQSSPKQSKMNMHRQPYDATFLDDWISLLDGKPRVMSP